MRDTGPEAPSTDAAESVPPIDWLPSPTLLIDAQGDCLAASDSACELLSLDCKALLGDGWINTFRGADENIRWIASMAGLKGGSLSMDLAANTQLGRSFQLEFKPALNTKGLLFVCLSETTSERQALWATGHYKTLLDRIQTISNTGYWRYDVSTGSVLWSDRVFEIHGLEPDPSGVNIDTAIAAYHPDDRQRVRDCISHSLETGEAFEFDLRILRPDGSIRYVVSRGEVENADVPGAARLFGVFHDVTSEREEDLAKQVTQERLRMVVEASRDGLWDWDFGSDVIFMSERLKEILGVTETGNAFDADVVRAFIHPEHRKSFYSLIDRSFKTGNRCDGEVRFVRADGTDGWVQVKAVASFNSDGKPGRVVCAVGDITERRQAEEELRQARVDALEASEAKSKFVATVSHELRTPLNGIIGMLDLLTSANLNSDQQPLADIAVDSARGLLAILDDLLDLSKLGANRLELNPVEFRPYDLVQGVIHLFAPGAAQRDMGIFLDVDPQVPDAIVADKVRLRQILSNLIGNALKFTDAGTINVYLSMTEGTDNRAKLRCSIQDTGIGIDGDAQARLFEPYVQASGKTFEEFGGTGLGLAICKQLAERMGGKIGVESQPGMGSTFWFTIDFAEPNDAFGDDHLEPAPTAVPMKVRAANVDASTEPMPTLGEAVNRSPSKLEAFSAQHAVNDPSKPHLLIAEDNAVNQRVITAMVSRLGYTYDLVEDGAQAIEAVRGTAYDAVLMDVQMPNIDGVMATRLIREEERDTDRYLPIIAITAHAMRGTKQDYLAAGMTDFVPKPISVKALAVSLHKLCGSKPKDSAEEKSTALGSAGA